jgi:hypothetical protein
MQLNLKTLTQAGAFTGAPVEEEITWSKGGEQFTATVFVRPLGYRSAVSDLLASAGKMDGAAGRIAACICDAEGVPVFTVQDIVEGPLDPEALALDPSSTKRLGALDGNLTTALLGIIGKVTNVGKTPGSPTSTSSGTNSRSRSAPRSRKPKSA